MTHRALPLLVVLALGFPVAGGEPIAGASRTWSVGGECTAEQMATYARSAERLRFASQADETYLPHPFPKTPQEALEDFVVYHRRATSHGGRGTAAAVESMEAADRRLFQVLAGDDLKVRVTRVANWTPSRCGRREQRDFFFVLQIFDGDEEITRAAVSPSGLVAKVAHWAGGPFEGDPPPLPIDPRDLLSGAAKSHPGRDYQYVTFSGTRRCDMLLPCVAFRSGPDVWVEWRDPIRQQAVRLRIEPNAKRHSVRSEMATPPATEELLERFSSQGREMLTLGGDELVEAVRVDD